MKVIFALVHSDLITVVTKIQNLKHIFDTIETNRGMGEQLLQPLTDYASITSFDSSHLVSFHEKLLFQQPVSAKKVRPLLLSPGSVMITEVRVYFQPAQLNNVGEVTQHFELSKITKVYKRRYLLRQVGLECYLVDRSSALFVFDSKEQRDEIHSVIVQSGAFLRGKGASQPSLEAVTRRWQKKQLSNFEYLMYLNTEADRSMNDLTQYPVFPHVLSDFSSAALDLQSPHSYRDLSKPVGALSPQRLEFFKTRFRSMPQEDDKLGIPPPFLYGTHYSTPGYVLFYLVRVAPEHMLCLQNGRFDSPDRMFYSVHEMWQSCLLNHADIKELIPEFFCGSGDFLVNTDDLPLGVRQRGGRLGDVELPPWAKSPKDFIKKMSAALESDYVSERLHDWIDLIFGYKQQGAAAVAADNLYYYLTYEGSVDLDAVANARLRSALELQIQEFGQTPKQLFTQPHPKKFTISEPVQQLLSSRQDSFEQEEREKGREREKEKVLNLSSDAGSSGQSLPLPQRERERDRTVALAAAPPARVAPLTVPATAESAAESPQIGFMHLGDDFHAEVVRQLAQPPQPPPPQKQKQPTPAVKSTKSLSMLGTWTSTLLERLGGAVEKAGPSEKQPAPPAPQPAVQPEPPPTLPPPPQPPRRPVPTTPQAMSDARLAELSRLQLLPALQLRIHSDAVSGLSLAAAAGAEHLTLASASKDCSLKVVLLDFDRDSAEDGSRIRSAKCRHTVRRAFSCQSPPSGGCSVSSDGGLLLVGCSDASVCCFSVAASCLTGRTLAHDDSVSAVSADASNKYFLSGSWDASVKLWAMTTAGLSTVPAAEWFDCDASVMAVRLSADGALAAAGTEDGKLAVWSTASRELLLSCAVSPSGRAVSCLCFLAAGREPAHLVVSGCGDGRLACFDLHGTLVAAARTGSGLRALTADKMAVFGVCEDGSIRVWAIAGGILKEYYRHACAHEGPATAIEVYSPKQIIVTGGENGTIRLWKIVCN